MRKDHIKSLILRTHRDERGSIAIIFGFSIFALCGFIGLAVDGARAYSIATRTQSILDSASLAAAKMLDAAGATDADVVAKATAFYAANLADQKDGLAKFENLSITPMRGSQTVAVRVDVVVPTYFAGVVGLDAFRFKRESLVIFRTKGVELAMVLDVTGSMSSSAGSGGSKIDAMKKAAKGAVKKLLESSSGNINTNRIALAPFSASVNVGSHRKDVADGPSYAKDNCVIERPGSAATSDDPISGASRARVMLSPGYGQPGASPDARYSCPVPAIQPLTNDETLLNTQLDGYAPAGGTAGHIGMAWGWNLISPNFASIFKGSSTPATYTDTSIIKSVVIMTDGLFNTAYKSGDVTPAAGQIPQSNGDFASLCTNMKAAGVIVYTIGFGLEAEAEPGRTLAKTTLANCASKPENFFDTTSDSELDKAFDDIADQLTALRVAS
jgi:Flp pilus assembly protein TadG